MVLIMILITKKYGRTKNESYYDSSRKNYGKPAGG